MKNKFDLCRGPIPKIYVHPGLVLQRFAKEDPPKAKSRYPSTKSPRPPEPWRCVVCVASQVRHLGILGTGSACLCHPICRRDRLFFRQTWEALDLSWHWHVVAESKRNSALDLVAMEKTKTDESRDPQTIAKRGR